MPEDKWELGAAVGGDGRIYAIGGMGGFMPQVTSVFAYDVGADRWTDQVAPLNERRRHFGTAVDSRGRIFVFSGYHQGFPFFSTTVEMFDPTLGYWQIRGEIPTARQGQSAATGPDGRIYVMGGGTFGDPIAELDIYNPDTGGWSRGADMTHPRTDFGCVTGYDGRIYVFGGYGEDGTSDGYLSSADVYDPVADIWAPIASMNIIRYSVAGALGADGRIYAIGGSVGSGAPTSVEAYDPGSDIWSFVASMATGRDGFAAVLGPDGRIYAIGGSGLSSVEAYIP
jgi:N-acetylneuraminic acid mutarotase